MKNFQKYKFRCSQLGKLMTNPRSKKDLLSKTTQSYLQEIYIEEVYGRKKEITSKYLDKGLYCEEDSLELASKHYEKLLIKNKKRMENDFITGIPDILYGKTRIIDIKTSWDIFTFIHVDGTDKMYFWQLQGYLALTGRRKAELIYCLVDTPEHLIVSEKNKLAWHKGIEDASEEMAELEDRVDKNMHYSDIPKKKRVKVFEFDFMLSSYEDLLIRIKCCRDYLDSLEL